MSDRQTWNDTWEQIAEVVAQRSQCSRRQVGAVIVDSTNRLIASGYNGPSAGFPKSPYATGCESFCERARTNEATDTYNNCFALHSEANALLQTNRQERQGATIYVNSAVCFNCAKLISNSGITKVQHKVGTDDEHRMPTRVETYLRDCGLTVVRW